MNRKWILAAAIAAVALAPISGPAPAQAELFGGMLGSLVANARKACPTAVEKAMETLELESVDKPAPKDAKKIKPGELKALGAALSVQAAANLTKNKKPLADTVCDNNWDNAKWAAAAYLRQLTRFKGFDANKVPSQPKECAALVGKAVDDLYGVPAGFGSNFFGLPEEAEAPPVGSALTGTGLAAAVKKAATAMKKAESERAARDKPPAKAEIAKACTAAKHKVVLAAARVPTMATAPNVCAERLKVAAGALRINAKFANENDIGVACKRANNRPALATSNFLQRFLKTYNIK